MRRFRRARRAAGLLVPLACVLGACRGTPARLPTGVDENRPAPRKPAPDTAVTAHVIASVGDRSIGPLLARRGAGPTAAGLVAWVTLAEGTGRRVMIVPIGPDGVPRAGESSVATVSVDTTMLVVRPMRGPAPGFVLAWTSLVDRGKSLWTMAVGDDGKPRSKPIELTRTTDDIVWVDAIATEHGATCLWAEATRGGDANLVAAPLNTDGKVRGTPTRVATGVVGWHAIELPNGIGLSTVTPSAADAHTKPKPGRSEHAHEPRGPGGNGGTLAFHRLDPDAHVLAPTVPLVTKPIVSGDVEVAREGSRLVFAWTDRTGEEPAISALALDDPSAPQPRVEPPRKLAEVRGGAALLGLASGPAGTAVLFEAPTRRKGEIRRVHAARIGSELVLDRKPLSIEVVGAGQPELAATSTGFALLATMNDCEPGTSACADAAPVSTLIRTDGAMATLQREPLTFVTDPATLGWAMSCDAETCFALAASGGPPGTPSRIRAAAVRPRPNARAAAAKPAAPASDGARIADITAVASGESVLDLAAARIGDLTIVATLSARADVPAARPARGEDARAGNVTIATRAVTDAGEAAAPLVITNRALAIGGVAIAPADRDKPDTGGAIAWVGRDGGDPEVHVTRIDRRGRRLNDVQLTNAKGDVNDVTITWGGGGWIVAWVDARDGNGEVYAAKVSPELARIGREERITNAPGDASDLVAHARGTDVWLAWADSRESPKDGNADVFVSAVRMRDAKRAFDEQRVLATAAHSRTPHLASRPEGMHVAWIEEAPLGSEATHAGYGAFAARLDATGRPADKPVRIPLAADGIATSVAIEAADDGVRAIVARSTSELITLDAVDLSTPARPRIGSLLSLDGPPSLDVALVLERGVLYFNDEGPRLSDRRARRATLAWPP